MRYALRNIVRLKTRSILSLLIVFSIWILAMLGFLIRQLCEDTRSHFYGPLDGSVHVTDSSYQSVLNYRAALTVDEDAEIITGVSAVKEYTGMLCDLHYVGYEDMRRYSFSGEEKTEDRKSPYLKGFSVRAVSSMDILQEVYGGDLTVTDGSMISDADTEACRNKIVISETLAERNGLSLGDTVILNTVSLFQEEYNLYKYLQFLEYNGDDLSIYERSYVIGGIYRHLVDNSAATTEPWSLNDNVVYVPISTVNEIAESESIQELYYQRGAYAIKSNPRIIPDALYFHLSDMNASEELETELNQIGFLDPIRLTEYVSDTASSPSVRLSQSLSYVLIGVIAIGFAILGLSVFFNMKTRHRELAMLIAIGKKRSSVTSDFFAELLVLILLGVVFSLALIAAFVFLYAEPLLRYLYSAELSAQFRGETADSLLLSDPVGNLISQSMAKPSYLISEYLIPSLCFSLIAALALLTILYVVVLFYTHRIRPLYDVGGKE